MSLFEIIQAEGFSILFPKILVQYFYLTYYESDNFSDSSLHHIFESKIFK